MQQNRCLPSSEWTHCHSTKTQTMTLLPFTSSSLFCRLCSHSPRSQWFIYFFFTAFLLSAASSFHVRLSKKWYFSKHLAQYCFSRALFAATGRQRQHQCQHQQMRRPKCACVCIDYEMTTENLFYLFYVYSIRSSEHTNALFSIEKEDTAKRARKRG